MPAMQARDPYVNRIVKAAKKLIADGLRDPSVSEIACAMLKAPMPTDPLAQPAELGGEIYHGIIKRLPRVRQQLEDVESIQAATVSNMYYQLGKREHPVEDLDEARMCLPTAGRPGCGLVAVVDGDANFVYQAWLTFNGKPGASRTRRALEQTMAAHGKGALTTQAGGDIVRDIDAQLVASPKEALAKITRKNGGTPATK